MIVRELEKAGIPAVQVCNMTPVANAVGVQRIWTSASIKYPLGAPQLPPNIERTERLRMTKEALNVLKS